MAGVARHRFVELLQHFTLYPQVVEIAEIVLYRLEREDEPHGGLVDGQATEELEQVAQFLAG